MNTNTTNNTTQFGLNFFFLILTKDGTKKEMSNKNKMKFEIAREKTRVTSLSTKTKAQTFSK